MESSASLSELLHPESADDFLANIWGKRFHVIKGRPGKFGGLFPWSALNDVLEQHRLTFPRLRLAKEGSSVPPERYTREIPLRRGGHRPELVSAAFAAELEAGATIVLDAADELYRPLTVLAESLEYELHERVQINAYVGWGDTRGFDLHWDDHDVIVLQLEGRKHWQVFGQTRLFPLYRDVEQPTPPVGEPLWDGFLEAGDLLYIPRGWWHVAVPLAEPTFHLTCGITKRTGMDVLAWLIERGRAVDICRQDVPRFVTQRDMMEFGEQLLRAISPRPAEDFVQAFLAEEDARAKPRPTFMLPMVSGPEEVTREMCASLIPPRPFEVLSDGDAIKFRALGQVWEFDCLARPLIDALIAHRQMNVHYLIAASGLADSDALALIKEMATVGLIALHTDR